MLPLDCDKHVKAKLETRGVRSAEEALKKSELDVIELIDVSLEKASKALRQIAKGACPKPINAFQMKEKSAGQKGGNFIKTGVKTLDEALLGEYQLARLQNLSLQRGAGKRKCV